MVYVMILLANFTVYSMGNNAAIAIPPPPSSSTQIVTVNENKIHPKNFDSSSAMKTFFLSSTGNTASVGGQSGGGGGKFRPVTSGTAGDGRFNGYWNYQSSISPDDIATTREDASVVEAVPGGGEMMSEEDKKLWNSIMEEAIRMQAGARDEALDHDTMQRFVSPVKAEMEADDQSDYSRTEVLYQMAVSQEPNNPLLLANYAQFLYLVVHDHDRAEEYFKRATRVGREEEEGDAEALSKYATFLWQVRKDICAAEETYLEAIAAEPGNTYHAATYAHFLWNTGGEDTCYPLDSPDEDFNNLV